VTTRSDTPIVVGTDEDGERAFIWIETRHSANLPDGTIPSEAAARQAIADTAQREGWSPDTLDPALMKPLGLFWFKGDDEQVGCDDDDPSRDDRFWVWDISEAVWAAP
jgi:hypothetical protein